MGVLIVGSLLWDNDRRQQWRASHLNLMAKERVWLPIRYGRKSGEQRRCIHTMVFSRLCYRQRQLGVGYIAPCVRQMNTPCDLIEEVQALADAEGLEVDSKWGAVGLLKNPAVELPPAIRSQWADYFRNTSSGCELFEVHSQSEGAVVSRDGALKLRWPTRVDGNRPVDFDLLLATPTVPTLNAGRYPSPKEIGKRYAERDYPTYFICNVENSIRTAQDAGIWREMVKKRPGWKAQYANVDALI